MLNNALKREALRGYRQAAEEQQLRAERVEDGALVLHELRLRSAARVITDCEEYVSSLANSPKEFAKSVSEFRIEYGEFSQLLSELEKRSSTGERVNAAVAGSGAILGAGVAAFAPAAALALATTFGVASTGTAISALSGAAATSAALAWLGGGALVAGGGGVAAGSTLLALAGPLGWTIGGATLAVGAVRLRSTNAKIARDAAEATIRVVAENARLDAAQTEIDRLTTLTQQHSLGVTRQLRSLREDAPGDFASFTAEQRETLGALINNVRSLARLLNHKVA